MSDSKRGTGRTTRALLALPAGSVFMVPTAQMIYYCRQILAKNKRDPKTITFVLQSSADVEVSLRGRRFVSYDADHACSEPAFTAERSRRDALNRFWFAANRDR